MTDLTLVTALRLRQRAARCRNLADTATSDGIAEELNAIAADYERDAMRLELRIPALRESVGFGLG